MDQLFEAGHVLRLFGDVMEDLLFSQHLNDWVRESVKSMALSIWLMVNW